MLDKLFIPRGTLVIVCNEEAETLVDTYARVTSRNDEGAHLLVDDVAALPPIQVEWNEGEDLDPAHLFLMAADLPA